MGYNNWTKKKNWSVYNYVHHSKKPYASNLRHLKFCLSTHSWKVLVFTLKMLNNGMVALENRWTKTVSNKRFA